jgi:hypothetical protein
MIRHHHIRGSSFWNASAIHDDARLGQGRRDAAFCTTLRIALELVDKARVAGSEFEAIAAACGENNENGQPSAGVRRRYGGRAGRIENASVVCLILR